MAREILSGDYAQSYAAKLARVQVIAAYPITPQTSVVEKLAEFVASGALPAQYIKVESEHSALQACVSAAALGARTYTATSSQGLLLMHELLHWASGVRAPVVMGVANRAVASPWSIDVDHTDTMSQRDTGWIQYYAESNQEVLDTVLTAFRIAEDASVRLPVMVAMDAFYLTHTVEPVDLPEPEQVDAFLPPRPKVGTLTPGVRGRLGSFTSPERYTEFRYAVARAMAHAEEAARLAEADYARITGRELGGPLPLYRTDGADAVLVTTGTATTTARAVVDLLRAEGQKVGLAKLRRFRPCPVAELQELARSVGRIGVLDRSFTYGAGGATATEVRASLYDVSPRPVVRGFVAGLGGRDVTPATVRQLFSDLLTRDGPAHTWADLRPTAPPIEVTHG